MTMRPLIPVKGFEGDVVGVPRQLSQVDPNGEPALVLAARPLCCRRLPWLAARLRLGLRFSLFLGSPSFGAFSGQQRLIERR
jgi:hypothetical protein